MDDDMTSADLGQLVEWFEEAESITYDARQRMDRDVDFYDGHQLTDEEREALRKRKQPAIVINQIKPEIDYLSGVEKSQRVDPKAYPRTPADEAAAYAATQGLRFVIDDCRYDSKRSAVWKGLLKAGISAAKVGVKETPMGYDPDIKIWSYDRFFYDPHSSELDFSDARYLGGVTWMDFNTAVSIYGQEYASILQSTMVSEGMGTHFEDKPAWSVWGDNERNRVRMVEIYYQLGGVWHEAIYTKGGVISNGPSPYLDEDGNPECPIVAQTAYIDRENRRYGQIREMIDPQTDYNKRRSKATHILNSNKIIAEVGAVDDTNKARREAAKPDAYMEVNPGKRFDMNGNAGLEMGQFQLMQEATTQLRANSIKNSMIGGNDQSGRAKQAQQQAAMMEIGDLLDNLRDFDKRVFEKCWNRIKQFWQGPRWIRVTDDPENVKHLGLNIPMNPQTGQALNPQEIQAIQAQGNVIDMAGNPVNPLERLPKQNPVAEMNVDLRIEDAPDVTSLANEDFERFTTLVPQLAQLPPQWARLVIELMPHSPGKMAAKALLDQMEQAQQQAPDPMQEEMKRLTVAEKAADIDKTQAETQETMAQAREREAKTMQAMRETMTPVAANQF